MRNKDWLSALAHEAPDELKAWFEAERETNGIGSSTNGISDDAPLAGEPPEGDAHSKAQSKDASTLSDLYGVWSDGNDCETPDFAENPQKTPEQGRKIDVNEISDTAALQARVIVRGRIAELEGEIANRGRRIEAYERRNAELKRQRDGWRMLCGELLDAAHAMQLIADAWDGEVR